ncbi:MAG: NAD+ synthase [Candidatus Thermoplasmatota archaeon]|nr:NAD+ synthase [Candidatus Thermoplasmatota archaeon]
MNIPSDTLEIVSNFIRTRVSDANSNGVVLGLSGGIDSAVTLCLAVNALGSDRVTGLIMPFTVTKSVDLAANHAKTLSVSTKIININDIVSSYKSQSSLFSEQLSEGNLHSRIRMSLLYGAGFSSNRLVIGTSNKSELLIGYWTKWGDGGTDFLPIGDLYKSQVFKLGKILKIPSEILDRKPTAELWPDQTDEEEFGFSYRELDNVLVELEKFNSISQISEKTGISIEKIDKIRGLIRTSIHKRVFPPVCKIGFRTVGLDWRETIGTQ